MLVKSRLVIRRAIYCHQADNFIFFRFGSKVLLWSSWTILMAGLVRSLMCLLKLSNYGEWIWLLWDLLLAKASWNDPSLLFADFILQRGLILLDIVDVVFIDVHFGGATAAAALIDLSHELFFVLKTTPLTLGLHSLLVIPMSLIRFLACLELRLIQRWLDSLDVTPLVHLNLELSLKHVGWLVLRDFLHMVLLHVESVLLGLRLVDVDLRQFVFLMISVPWNSLCSHGDFHFILSISALHFYARIGPFIIRFSVNFQPCLQRMLINFDLAPSLGVKAVLLGLDIRLVHCPQVMIELFVLLSLCLCIYFVVSHLGVEQLLPFNFVLASSLVFQPHFSADRVHAGGLLFHTAQRLFILIVSLVFGHLVYQVLHAMVLKSFFLVSISGLVRL